MPVPEEVPNGVTHYVQGNDPTEKLIHARLEDPSKCKQWKPCLIFTK